MHIFCTNVYLYIYTYICYIYCAISHCRRPKNNSRLPAMAKSKRVNEQLHTYKHIFIIKIIVFFAVCITTIATKATTAFSTTLSKYYIQISTNTTVRCRCWHQISTKFNFLISIPYYSLHSDCQRVKPTNSRTCKQVNCRKVQLSIGLLVEWSSGRTVEFASTVCLTAVIWLAVLGFRSHNGTGLTALGRAA